MFIEPLFFRGASGARLCGIWRRSAPDAVPVRVWVVCAPFAEEEKSAHRTLVELADSLVAAGDAVFFFAYRGTGDSDGEFAAASLTAWSEDILDACEFARAQYPQSALGLIGLRLGASLAAQVGEQLGAKNFILLEPVLRGRSFVMQLGARKKIRAAMTAQESGVEQPQATPQPKNPGSKIEDIDGWALGETMREELRALDLSSHPPQLEGAVLLLQVGPRKQLAPPLEQFGHAVNVIASTQALVMPPFWNRLDHVESKPLLEAVSNFKFGTARSQAGGCASHVARCEEKATQAVTLNSADQTLVVIEHNTQSTKQAPQLIFLHGWTGYRTGPHQMLARAARRFTQRGYCGLRFDFAGRGDSSGNAALTTLATMADDARAAIRHARAKNPAAPVVLVGLCSGCEVAFAVADEPGVAGLVLWSAPVFAAGQSEERVARKRAKHLKDYARKLMRPATWGKVLSGRIDVKGVRKVVGQGGGEEFKNVESSDAGHLPPGWRADAMQRFENVRVPSLLVYGSADPTTPEALAWYRGQLRVEPKTHLVEGANHSYYGLEWEAEVFQVTEEWLKQQSFGVSHLAEEKIAPRMTSALVDDEPRKFFSGLVWVLFGDFIERGTFKNLPRDLLITSGIIGLIIIFFASQGLFDGLR